MEFCSHNLNNILQLKNECFGRKPNEFMDFIEYYISYKLFEELLELIRYLHESDPPIAHRNLKPNNILINENPMNAQFLKLNDFGFDNNTELNSTINLI